MSHDMEILHHGAAFRTAIRRGAEIVAAGRAQAEAETLGAATVRAQEQPACWQ